jgi:hypothetical protein
VQGVSPLGEPLDQPPHRGLVLHDADQLHLIPQGVAPAGRIQPVGDRLGHFGFSAGSG